MIEYRAIAGDCQQKVHQKCLLTMLSINCTIPIDKAVIEASGQNITRSTAVPRGKSGRFRRLNFVCGASDPEFGH
jgi:hypothetical protein